MHSTADWINPAATRDSVIAICRNVLTFRAEFLANTHTRAYLVRHVQWLESERKVAYRTDSKREAHPSTRRQLKSIDQDD